MKNFYYEKCRKSIHYKDLPINRRKVSVYYYYKIVLNKNILYSEI